MRTPIERWVEGGDVKGRHEPDEQETQRNYVGNERSDETSFEETIGDVN